MSNLIGWKRVMNLSYAFKIHVHEIIFANEKKKIIDFPRILFFRSNISI